jgi:hypothetical protein
VRYLLAPEPGRTPAAAARESDLFGLQVCAALAEEVGELGAALLTVRPDHLDGRGRRDLSFDGGDRYYQDNSFSCTWISIIADYTT